jgi:uncharacterized RDD family membrane protein YckC
MGSRFVARVLDWLIVGVPLGALIGVVFVAQAPGEARGMSAQEAAGVPDPQVSGAFLASIMGVAVLGLIAAAAYEIVLVAMRGATLGKQAAGVRVVRAGTGQVPGWGASFGRWGIQCLASFIPYVGLPAVWISPLFSANRQGLHDKAAGTLVVTSGTR